MQSQNGNSRREFLKGTLATAAAMGTLKMTQADSPIVKDAPKWPITCRDAHLKEVGESDIWAAAKAIGTDGLEVQIGLKGELPGLFGPEAYTVAHEAGIAKVKDALEKAKLKITAFCMMNHFDERLEEEIRSVELTAAACRALGVKAVRLDVVPRSIKDEDEFLKFAIDAGKQVVKVTEGTDVRFGVENHGRTTNKVEFLKAFFDGVGSKRFGITLDTANFYWYGYPLSKLYEIYAQFAGNACHTHCKNVRYPETEREKQREIGWEYGKYNCPVYEGDIEMSRVAKALNAVGYQGDLCIENESLRKYPQEERGKILKRETDYLREVARLG
jgi:sugar phosphate isomerase/epimerase